MSPRLDATLRFILRLVLIAMVSTVEAQSISVTADRMLEVESGTLRRHPLIKIDKGLIVAIDTRAAGQTVDVDLGDVTLLPGLIDAHTHLVGREEETPYQALTDTAAIAAIAAVVNARKTIEVGFTTVRDLGSRDFADVALREAIARGEITGPRMWVAVSGLSSTGGHGDRNELPNDVEVHRFSGIADGGDELRKKVRELVKRGADWIKVLATGGVMSAGTDPRQADYTEEELRVAVETAQAKGRDVAAHAHGTEGIKRAVRAGVRSIEHASMLDDEALALIKERGIFVVPNPYTNAYMLERGPAGGYQPYQLAKAKEVYGLKMASLRRAIRAGLNVAYGTDAGVQPHGINGRQFALFVEAGMTPLQAIQAATLVNARLLRQEGKLGTIRVGAWADLIAVAGNPLETIRSLEQPSFVMKGGVVVVRR